MVERSSSVRVLTSVSRVTIGSPIVSEITRRKIARRLAKSARTSHEVSRLGTRSFRLNNMTSREPKRHMTTSALIVDQTMLKLTSLTPKLPYVTRKIACQSGTEAKLEIAKNFDLSNILNSPRPPPEGRETPRKRISSNLNPASFSVHSRSPLKVITNSSSTTTPSTTSVNNNNNNKSFCHKNLGLAEFAKYAISTSTSLAIGSPERLADLELIDKRIDMLLKTA